MGQLWTNSDTIESTSSNSPWISVTDGLEISSQPFQEIPISRLHEPLYLAKVSYVLLISLRNLKIIHISTGKKNRLLSSAAVQQFQTTTGRHVLI